MFNSIIYYISIKIVLIHINCGVRLCAVCSIRYAMCGCPAFEFMECAAVCGRAHSFVRQCGSVRGSVRLSGVHAAVCGCPAVRQCAAVQQ